MSDASGTGISHVFFEVPGVLVDRVALRRSYRVQLGQIMSERYGSTAANWSAAYDRVLADWDNYYADLNLSGDDGIADMWEGLFRTTRALFRLNGVPEPNKSDLIAFSRELPESAARDGDALYSEVPEQVKALDQAGLVLGVISYSLTGVVRALLAPVGAHFKGALLGADHAIHFEKDAERYLAAALSAQVEPERCLIVDEQPTALLNARSAGMQTFRVERGGADLNALVKRCLSSQSASPPR